MAEFKKALRKSELQAGMGKTVEIDGQEIALFNVEGQVHAIENTCLHAGGPLGEGELSGKEVTCPWHGWQYDVSTGATLHDPNLKVKSYEVKVEGEDILVSV